VWLGKLGPRHHRGGWDHMVVQDYRVARDHMGGQDNKCRNHMVHPNQGVAGITEAAVITRVVGTTGVPGPQ
jgi:hypothetical protein